MSQISLHLPPFKALSIAGLLACSLWSTPVWAQDDNDLNDVLNEDDFDFEEPEAPIETEPGTETPKPPVIPDEEPDEDTLDFTDPIDDLDADDPIDLLGDEDPKQPTSGDTAAVYRMTLAKDKTYEADDALQLWDAYLTKYPNTPFRQQIELRMNELEGQLYAPGGGKPDDDKTLVDADELDFAHGVLLDNINPRDRFLAQLEFGLPGYASLALDLEKALMPNLSVHGGFRRRFTGFNVEGGVRYAIVKSPRTKTLLTVGLDARLNTGPAFVAARPLIGFGKSIGKLDIQAQAGAELSTRDIRIVGGLNGTYHASEAISLLAEASLYLNTKGAAAGPFRFNQASVGMAFRPRQKAERPQDTTVTLAATVPVSSAYWQFHFGSVMGQLVQAF